MDTLKIYYTNFWPEWKDENFIQPILEKYYRVIIDKWSPDVLFHSIFGEMSETKKYNCKKIQFLGENRRPSLDSDYSISFDPQSKTNYRLPLWQVFLLLNPEIKSILFGKKIKYKKFERFCSFTVSNSGNISRNGIYQQLNQYKRVHSYGRYMTNDLELQEDSKGKYWRDAKYKFFKKHTHKFALVYENNPYKYYCTEKLMDAFLAGSMPIYWGDPKIREDWNTDAFLDVTKLPDPASLIRSLDQNDIEFNRRYSQPIFTEKQKENHIRNLAGFENWLINVIES